MRIVRPTKITALTIALVTLLAVALAACGGSSSREIHASEYVSTGWRLTVESAELWWRSSTHEWTEDQREEQSASSTETSATASAARTSTKEGMRRPRNLCLSK